MSSIKNLAQKVLQNHQFHVENGHISGSEVDWVDFTNEPGIPEEASVLFFHTKKHKRDQFNADVSHSIAVSDLEKLAE